MSNEFRVMTSGAFTAAYKALIPQLEQLTGKTIVTVTTSIGTGDTSIPNRLKRGEVADLVIVAEHITVSDELADHTVGDDHCPLDDGICSTCRRTRSENQDRR